MLVTLILQTENTEALTSLNVCLFSLFYAFLLEARRGDGTDIKGGEMRV